MALKWILILCLYITGSAKTVDLSEASFVSAKPGEPVTLHCKFVERFSQNNWVWYKQRSGQEPQEVAVKLPSRDPTTSERFKIDQHFSMTIEQTTKDDEGMYFCGKGDDKTITFSNGTFLAVAEGPVDPAVIFLGAALGVCVVVISAETIIICKRRNSDHCSGRKQQGSSAENTTSQTAESLNYAPIHFKENKPKPGRVKREQPEDIVYSQTELYFTDSAQAVRNSELLVVSAEPGEAVTLTCPPVDDSDADVRMWYKERLEHAPLEVGSKLKTRESIISAPFDRSRFKIDRIAGGISLSIERVTKEDEGMYFCAAAGEKTMSFSNATFLAVTDDHHDQSVLVVVMGVALGLSVMWNIGSWRRGSCSDKTSQSVNHNYSEELQVQDSDSEEFDFTALRFSEKMKRRALKEKVFTRTAERLNYAPIHFKENKPKPGRVKREQPEDIAYSQVRSSNAKAHRSHR
ncbi:hypothetical protein MHYP_G00107850 [Metynnis hypsauchen]